MEDNLGLSDVDHVYRIIYYKWFKKVARILWVSLLVVVAVVRLKVSQSCHSYCSTKVLKCMSTTWVIEGHSQQCPSIYVCIVTVSGHLSWVHCSKYNLWQLCHVINSLVQLPEVGLRNPTLQVWIPPKA